MANKNSKKKEVSGKPAVDKFTPVKRKGSNMKRKEVSGKPVVVVKRFSKRTK